MRKNGSGSAGVPLNATTILAVLTLVGGAMLVTNKLTSDRPKLKATSPNPGIFEQKVSAWLWEDPLKSLERVDEAGKSSPQGHVAGEIIAEQNSGFQVLAVMVPGGSSGEDQETRIRYRFAIVSALAESAYAPRHEAHIGLASMPWPSTLELDWQLTNGACPPIAINQSSNSGSGAEGGSVVTGVVTNNSHYGRLYYGFEWYECVCTPLKSKGQGPEAKPPVLLLWLDEDLFNDSPLARLDLLFCNLRGSNGWTATLTNTASFWKNHPISLIGPCSSATLKVLLDTKTNEDGSGTTQATSTSRGRRLPLKYGWTNITRYISIYLATPRVIDEVLVSTPTFPRDYPRQAVLEQLQTWFCAAYNFAAPDSDIARAVLQELRSRGIDLINSPQHHLVMIGGWDEYFGRMFTAAYAAELETWQQEPIDRHRFIHWFLEDNKRGPTNFHPFFYLSGLDGQGLVPAQADNIANFDLVACHCKDTISESAIRWIPDVNRAEGPAQYDYLGRLAGRIEDLNAEILSQGTGKVSAIGIGGGDVYDTLLILKALRPRFPEAIFFTTELDARYWDPKEWEWTRNLVVVSGYGLSLDNKLQGKTAPFRDSRQTAVFAAALRALGNTNVSTKGQSFPVRRFEIGFAGPLDISPPFSPASPPLALNFVPTASIQASLHPVPKPWLGLGPWLRVNHHGLLIALSMVGGLLLLLAISRTFQRLTFFYYQTMAASLWLREEDIGGVDGWADVLATTPTPPGIHQAEREQSIWLKRILAPTIELELRSLDRALQERMATRIFRPADILDAGEFLRELKDRVKAQNDRNIVANHLWEHFSPPTQTTLDHWKGGENTATVLDEVVQDIRQIICTTELPKSAKLPTDEPSPDSLEGEEVLWRKNRRILEAEFKKLIKPEQELHDCLSLNDTQAGDRGKLKTLLKDPELRACVHFAMLRMLDAWNAELVKPEYEAFESDSDVPAMVTSHPQITIPRVRSGGMLDRLNTNRKVANSLIQSLMDAAGQRELSRTTEAAHQASLDLHKLWSIRCYSWAGIILVALFVGLWMGRVTLLDAPSWSAFFSGASVWPINWLYFITITLGAAFVCESYFRLRNAVLQTTRECRLGLQPAASKPATDDAPQWRTWRRIWKAIRAIFQPCSLDPVSVVIADEAWETYQKKGGGTYRFLRSLCMGGIYVLLMTCIYHLVFGHLYNPALRNPGGLWYLGLMTLAFLFFVFLSFWTLDAAFLCRWFILYISRGPTHYSLPTWAYFSRRRGYAPYHVLSEWIDVSIIAQITQQVGGLVYFPAVLLLLMLLSAHNSFYYFPWPTTYYVFFACNMCVAAASVFILQYSACKARDQSTETLQKKLNILRANAAATQAEKKRHDIQETEDLLEEIRTLDKGAFSGFWSNPAVGALLLPSGGTALIEIIKMLTK